MKELGSCEGGISGEHLITSKVMTLLADKGHFTISGLPWIPDGKTIAVGINSLRTNCLCRKHNSALHPLDDAAIRFFATLKSCLDRQVTGIKFLVSGHDIERWLLKTTKALAISGNLAQGQNRLSGAFSKDVRVIEMLDDPQTWPPSTGLYCIMQRGMTMENNNRFQLAPLTNERGEIGGLSVNVMGVAFILILEPLDMADNLQLKESVFRPNQIVIRDPLSTSWLAMSWEDSLDHNKTLFIDHVRERRA